MAGSACYLAALEAMDMPLINGFSGINPSGAADESSAIVAAVAGGACQRIMGSGTFPLRSTVAVPASYTTLKGVNTGATVVNVDDSLGNIGDGFLLSDIRDGRIEDMIITAASARSAGNAIRIVGGLPGATLDGGAPQLVAGGHEISRVDMTNQFNGLVVNNDVANDRRNWRLYVKGGKYSGFAVGGCGILIDAFSTGTALSPGASHFIENWWFGQTPAQTLAGVRIRNTGDASLTNCEVYGANYAVLVDPISGAMVTSVNVTGGFYDRSRLACMRIAPDSAVGRFGAINFVNVWFAGSTLGNVIELVGSKAKYISFTNCTFYSAEGGWCVYVDGCDQVHFVNCHLAGALSGGYRFTGSSTNFSVIGGSISGAGVATSISTMPIGIQIDAGCDHYTIDGVNIADPAVGTKITNTPGTSANRRVIGPGIITA